MGLMAHVGPAVGFLLAHRVKQAYGSKHHHVVQLLCQDVEGTKH
jgi:hypothetical protein